MTEIEMAGCGIDSMDEHWPLTLELLRGVYSAQWASVEGLHTGLLEGSKAPQHTSRAHTRARPLDSSR